jgi:hypothetical protein
MKKKTYIYFQAGCQFINFPASDQLRLGRSVLLHSRKEEIKKKRTRGLHSKLTQSRREEWHQRILVVKRMEQDQKLHVHGP